MGNILHLENYIQSVLKLDEKNLKALFNLTLYHIENDDVSNADEILERAYKFYPNHPNFLEL